MMSGAEGELNQGADQGTEEVLDQGADQGSQRTGDEGEKWEDLNPEDFPQIPVEVVTNLNKKAVTQFQNKVRKIAESNKPFKEKAEKMEALMGKMDGTYQDWMSDPEKFLAHHREKNPEYWASRTNKGGEPSADDKAAIEALRKAGIVTMDDLKKHLGPIAKALHGFKSTVDAKGEADAQAEIDAHEKWCKENKYPWDENIGTACVALISAGKAKDLKSAYDILAKPLIDQANQANLKRKKGGITSQASGGKGGQKTNLTLRQIVEQSAEEED
ncbi:MAG: hypothetical protein KKB59_19230 [Spirochaetes bacterium]|nr:hypothetical protein [Spirochaetota bacterium]